MSNRAYDFNLAAAIGATARLDVQGTYLKVQSASGGAVGVKLDGGQEIILLPGQGFRILPDSAGRVIPFRDVTVRNLQAVANAGSIFIGSAGFEDSRITGSVEIIDGGRVRTLSGVAFLCGGSLGNLAGNVPHGQIWNPAGSGIRVMVQRVIMSSATAGSVQLRASSAALSGTVGNVTNKNINQANLTGVQHLFQFNPTTLGLFPVAAFNIQAGGSAMYQATEPLILLPGVGLIAFHATVAADLAVTWEGYIETI